MTRAALDLRIEVLLARHLLLCPRAPSAAREVARQGLVRHQALIAFQDRDTLRFEEDMLFAHALGGPDFVSTEGGR